MASLCNTSVGSALQRGHARSLLAAALACGLGAAQAQTPPGLPLMPNDALLQEQDRLRFEQERLQVPIPPSGVDLRSLQPPALPAAPHGPCRDIQTVAIVGAEQLSAAQRDRLAGRFADRCLAAADIQQLMADLTQLYIAGGFVTTRVYLPAQDLGSGKLQLLVQEGRIERIAIDGDSRILLSTAFPVQAGDVLNIRDLEQAVDQINSARGNNVKMALVPGSQPGLTVVQLTNTPSKPYAIELGLDNSGGDSATGRLNGSASVITGGVLGLNETMALTMRSTTRDDSPSFARSAGFRWSMPLGHNTVGFNVSHSAFRIDVPIPMRTTPFFVEGKSDTVGLTFDRNVYRDQTSRHSVTSSLSGTDSRIYVGGELARTASQKTAGLALGVSSMWVTGGGVLMAHPQVVVGKRDLYTLPIQAPDSDRPSDSYHKFTLDLDFERAFAMAQRPWLWRSSFRGQYSPVELYASERFTIGGLASVRGVTRNPISGDSGFHWRNALVYKQQADVAGHNLKLDWYGGIDLGRVISQQTGSGAGTLGSLALGVAARVGPAAVDVTYTHVLKRPSAVFPEPRNRIWFRTSVTF